MGLDHLHLAVEAFDPWRRPLVKLRQGAAGSGVVVVAGSGGSDGVGGLENVMGNPAGCLPYKVEDITGGKCLASKEVVEERRPLSQFVPLPLSRGGQSDDINAPGQLTNLEDHNHLL